MNYSAFVNEDLSFVPFAERLLVLWFGRDHVVKGCRHAVAVHAKFGIGMVRVVKNLVFGCGNIDGFKLL